jgi:UDP-N-acetylglucosamine 2-epimerase (non-hydrolysing)
MDVSKLHLAEPQPYIEFLALQRRATVVITDSGGIQEETTYLKVPCLTLRSNTERPVTVDMGTNILIGQDFDRLRVELSKILKGQGKASAVPPLWDGLASERIADVLEKALS